MPKKVVLTLCDYFRPGHKAGGPIKSVANLVHHLSPEFDFRVVTRDRDLNDSQPFSGIEVNDWSQHGCAKVHYLQALPAALSKLREILQSTPHDTLYLNSAFSSYFSIYPILLQRLGRIPRRPIILAPRGEFAPDTLAIRTTKKLAFLRLSRLVGFHGDINWQASSPFEAIQIRRRFGRQARVTVAPNLPVSFPNSVDSADRAPKAAGHAKVLFLSRISKIKNLDYAIQILAGLHGRIEFDIYGPLEDPKYWKYCQSRLGTLPNNVTVTYRGSVEPASVSQVLQTYDLFVFPTRSESFGHVIFEAMSSACPPLISDRTPWRNLEQSAAGWDIPLEQPSRFRAVIQRVIDSDEATHASWRDCTRRYADSFCRNETLVEQSRQLFLKAAEQAELPRSWKNFRLADALSFSHHRV